MADKNGHIDLDGLFDAARRDSAALPEALSERILADAAQVQAGFAEPPVRAPSPGLWRQVMVLLGGWPALGGLAAACAAGVWIGVSPPAFLPDPAGLVSAAQSEVDVLGGYSLSSLYLEDG